MTDRTRTKEQLLEELDQLRCRIADSEHIAHRCKELEEALRDQEEQNRLLYDDAPLAYQSLDGQGRILRVNNAWIAMLGYESADALGTWFGEYVAPERREEFERRFSEFTKIGVVQGLQLELARKDGSRLAVAVDGVAVSDSPGKSFQTHCILRDETERLSVENALKLSQTLYHDLVEQVSDLVFRTEANGRLSFVNAAATRVTGCDVGQLLGLHFLDLIDPNYRAEAKTFYENLFSERILSSVYEVPIINGRGDKVWLEQHIELLVDGDRCAGLQIIARDVTRRRFVEDELRASEQRFREFLDNLPQFVYELDIHGNLTFLNRAGLYESGYSSTDISRGLSIRDFIVMDDVDRAVENLTKVLAGNATKGNEYLLRRKDGSTLAVLFYSSRVESDGGIVGIRGVGVDISPVKKKEGELHASKQRIEKTSSLLTAMNTAQERFISHARPSELFEGLLKAFISITESQYGFISEVHRAEDGSLYHQTHSLTNIAWDAEIRAFYESFAPEGLQFRNLDNLPGAVLRTEAPVISNVPGSDPHAGGLPPGHPPVNSFLGLPLKAGGEVVGIVGLANRFGGYSSEVVEFLRPYLDTCAGILAGYKTDTRRRKLETSLAQSETRFRVIYERAPVMMHSLDVQGIVRNVNRKWLLEMGYDRNEVLGKPIELFMTADSVPALHENLERFWSDREIGDTPYRYVRKDGSVIDVLIDSVVVEDAEWGTISLTAVRDTTKQNKAEQALRDAADELEFGVRELTEVLSEAKSSLEKEIEDRIQAERALREQERIYRSLVETARDIIWTVDLDLKYTYVSPSVTNNLGYTVDEIMSLNPLDGLTERSRERIMAVYQEETSREMANPRREGVSRTEEIERYRKDGELCWEEISTTFLRDDEGRPTGVLGISRDITERKRLEQEFRDSENQYRLLFEHAGDGILLMEIEGDAPGRIVSANRRAGELHGYSVEELTNLTIADLDTPESAEKIPDRFVRIMKGEWITEETTHRKKDGTIIPVEIRAGLIEVGSRRYVLALDRDITDRKRVQEALQAKERKFREFAQFLPQFVYEMDNSGRFTFLNRSGLEAIGYTEQDLSQGIIVLSVFPQGDRTRVEQDLQRILGGEDLLGAEYLLMHKDGTTLPIVTYSSPILEDGTVVGVRGIVVDISELKEVQDELRKTNTELEYRVEERTRELLDANENLQREMHNRISFENALRESEAHYRSVVENAREGILVVQQGRLEYVNPQVQRVTGYTEEELLGSVFQELVHVSDRNSVLPCLSSIGEGTCESGHCVARISDRGGTVTWMDMSFAPFDWGGSPGQLVFWKDITDRKAFQDEILAHNKFLHNVLESLTHPFYVIDAEDYSISMANSAARLDLSRGITACYSLTHGRTRPCESDEHPCPLEAVKRSGLPVTVEHEHFDNLGNKRNVEIHAYPIISDEGAVTKVIEYALDVTDRKQAEKAAKTKMAELTAINRLAEKITSTLSRRHVLTAAQEELRGALRADLTLTHMLENGHLVLQGHYGTGDGSVDYQGPQEKLVGECLCGLAAQEKKVCYSEDLSSDPRATLDACKRANVKSVAAIPLMSEDTCLGVLGLASFEHRDFSLQAEFIETMAQQVASGLQNALLYERLTKHAEDMEREIAERKRAEDLLRRSEERFRAVFDGAQDAVFIKDKALRFTHVNPAMERLLGVKASELVGHTDAHFLDLQTAKHFKTVDVRVLGGEVVEEERTQTIYGMPLTFLDVRVPLRNVDGEVTGLCGFSRNVTERLRAKPSTPVRPQHYRSEAIRATLAQAKRAAEKGSIILLLGESGSGKDYLARWIHSHSERANGPYFAVNCAAIPRELAESELFGHEAGAFSGARGRKRGLLELAEGGTLLLNEIGELPLSLQSKLLTFLDTKSFLRIGGEKSVHVDARLLAATNRDLKVEVTEGRFLEPLYYRINVFSIVVPPLRERIPDLADLTEELLTQIGQDLHMDQVPTIHPSEIDRMSKYAWPGNVRELRNTLERALMLWDGGLLRVEIPSDRRLELERKFIMDYTVSRTLDEITGEITSWACTEALRHASGNRSDAARLLGVSRETMHRYIRKYDLKSHRIDS